MLSASSVTASLPATDAATNSVVQPTLTVIPQSNPGPTNPAPQAPPTIIGHTPQQIQQAYGVSSLLASGTTGKGETIAIVDAYYDPNIVNDVQTFANQFNLQQFNISGGPYLKVVTSSGSGVRLATERRFGAGNVAGRGIGHAIAPGANILLVRHPMTTCLRCSVPFATPQTIPAWRWCR